MSLIIALDVPSRGEAEALLARFQGETLYVKVGMELFYREGPAIITYLKAQGHRIFLDLKLHDIPNTVQAAMRNLARLGVDMVNVHAAGGTRMMQAALAGLTEGTPAGQQRPLCVAVTQLTSTSEHMMQQELWIEKPLTETVLHYAKLAQESGLDGVVCSALEANAVRERCGSAFAAVTPGIRQAADAAGDQVRIVTPAAAREMGATYIVVGRSITGARDPLAAYRTIQEQWEGVTK